MDQQCRCRLKTVIVQLLWVGAQLPTRYSTECILVHQFSRHEVEKESRGDRLETCGGRPLVVTGLTMPLLLISTLSLMITMTICQLPVFFRSWRRVP